MTVRSPFWSIFVTFRHFFGARKNFTGFVIQFCPDYLHKNNLHILKVDIQAYPNHTVSSIAIDWVYFLGPNWSNGYLPRPSRCIVNVSQQPVELQSSDWAHFDHNQQQNVFKVTPMDVEAQNMTLGPIGSLSGALGYHFFRASATISIKMSLVCLF